MNAPFVLINDALVPAGRATLHVSDLAIQRGYGIFDFFKTVNHRPAFLDDHLDRFFHSARRMRLQPPVCRDALKSLLAELLRHNDIPDSGVRITLTGGYSPDAYSIATPNLIVTQSPLVHDPAIAERGMRLITFPHRRQLSDVKTIDYLVAVWLQPAVRDAGADDVLYHLDGVVSECPRSNFAIVTADDRIVTPGEHVLNGIVRKHVLDLAASCFDAARDRVTLDDIRNAKEAFVTSTTKGVMPVVQVDGRPIGDGRPGPVTRWLGEQFDARLAATTA